MCRFGSPFYKCTSPVSDLAHLHVVFICYVQETLLVHKDLVQTGGLNELVVELRTEGRNFLSNNVLVRCSNFILLVQFRIQFKTTELE